MITTTRTAAAALILSLFTGLAPALLAAEPSPFGDSAPLPALRDDGLAHAVLDILPEPEPVPQPEPAPAVEPSYGDPYGFAAILNSFRASAGLPPVAFCPNLSAWASQNNAAQCSMGLGHHIMANFFQNSGYNQSSVSDVARSWIGSPGHAQNMLAPSATRFGIAYGPGPYWTLNLQ